MTVAASQQKPSPARESDAGRLSSTSIPTCSTGGWCGPTACSAPDHLACAGHAGHAGAGHQAGAHLPGAWLASPSSRCLFVLVFTTPGRAASNRSCCSCAPRVGLIVQLTAGWTESLQSSTAARAHEPWRLICCSRCPARPPGCSSSSGTDHSVYGSSGRTPSPRNTSSRARKSYTSPQVETSRQSDYSSCTGCWAVVRGLRYRRHRDPLQHRRRAVRGDLFEKRLARRLYRARINRLVA